MLTLAACRTAAAPTAPSHRADTPGPCSPVGTWHVTWAPVVEGAYLHALGREFELRVDDAVAEVEGWQVLRGNSEDDVHAEVDRARCTARVTLRSEFSFADDAGDRTEHLVLDLELHGDGGEARGTVHLVEVGSDPEDRHVDARGRVARVVDE